MLSLGQSAFYSKTVNEDDVISFANISGDYNSIHVDEEEAKKSGFKKRVVHGMLIGSYVSTVLGTIMPGTGTIYLEQLLRFVGPVYVNDSVNINITVSEVLNEKKGIYKLSTQVFNGNGELVVDGYAIVKKQ